MLWFVKAAKTMQQWGDVVVIHSVAYIVKADNEATARTTPPFLLLSGWQVIECRSLLLEDIDRELGVGDHVLLSSVPDPRLKS